PEATSGRRAASRPTHAPIPSATSTMKISNASLSFSPNSATTMSFAPGGWMSTTKRAIDRTGEGTPATTPARSSPTASAAPTATAPANARRLPIPSPITLEAYAAAHDGTLTPATLGPMIDVQLQVDLSIRLVFAALLGLAIGFEREIHGHPAGLRTHMLVAVGSALFTVLSAYAFGQGGAGQAGIDPTRIAAQIVSGIGFLGAGAILKDGIVIRGLTTAASLWATS